MEFQLFFQHFSWVAGYVTAYFRFICDHMLTNEQSFIDRNIHEILLCIWQDLIADWPNQDKKCVDNFFFLNTSSCQGHNEALTFLPVYFEPLTAGFSSVFLRKKAREMPRRKPILLEGSDRSIEDGERHNKMNKSYQINRFWSRLFFLKKNIWQNMNILQCMYRQ